MPPSNEYRAQDVRPGSFSEVPEIPRGSGADKVKSNRIPDSGEFYATALLGFRRWVPHRDGAGEVRLLSTVGFTVNHVGRTPWDAAGITKAHCVYNALHEAPEDYCTCGIHAFAHHTEIRNNGGTILRPRQFWLPQVAGLIAGWGTQDLADVGFKCQYAKVMALMLPDVKWHVKHLHITPDDSLVADLHELAVVNGIPLLPHDHFEGQQSVREYADERAVAIFPDLI